MPFGISVLQENEGGKRRRAAEVYLMNMRRLAALVLILCVPAVAAAKKPRKHKPAPVDDRVFAATPDSLILQNEAIDAMGLPRIRDDRQLRSLVSEEALVPVTVDRYVAISPKLEAKRRYVRPTVDEFLQELGREYFEQFGKPIQVNSAVRTVRTQIGLLHWNRNAAPAHGDKASAHLAGVAVDLQRRGLTPEQIRFVQRKLLIFARMDMVIVDEELREPCFHIVVTGNYPVLPAPDLQPNMPLLDPLLLQPTEPEKPQQ
jgi:hypothetical protein